MLKISLLILFICESACISARQATSNGEAVIACERRCGGEFNECLRRPHSSLACSEHYNDCKRDCMPLGG
jgi:hypothetical protein